MSISTIPASVGDIEAFVTMLHAARSDSAVRARLERLLSLPDERRAALVHAWVGDLLVAEAPREFVLAVACLQDDGIAGKAYEVIRDGERTSRMTRLMVTIVLIAMGSAIGLMLIL